MNKIKISIIVILIIAILLGITWITHADTENQLTITFQDTVLCNKVADELSAYKNNENDKAINYLISKTDNTVTIDINNLSKILKLNLSGSSSNSNSKQITNLSGIGSFSALQELNLDNNSRISERINSQSNIHEIYNLTNLRSLSLAGTSIYNVDLNKSNTTNNISKLTNLENLNLSSTNIFSNTLLNDLNGLNNLKKLNLANNRNINNLDQIVTNITELNIDNTGITQIDNIRNFKSLEKLYIGHNSIEDISFIYETYYDEEDETDKTSLNNLTLLNMDYMNEGAKTGNIFSELQPLGLISLSLRGNDIGDLYGLVSDDENAMMSETLKYLDLADNYLESTDGIVLIDSDEYSDESILKKSKITNLILTNNAINQINQLQYINTLTTLRLGNNRIQDITPIMHMQFEEGKLELNNQRLSMWVYQNTDNSKEYQYLILPNIIQQAKVNGSLVYSSDVEIEVTGVTLNNDKPEYQDGGKLNLKIPCQINEETEVSVRVKNGLADGTVLKCTYQYYNDEKPIHQTYQSQNDDPIETIKFNDSNLENAIYNYLQNNKDSSDTELDVTYLKHIPNIINVNRAAVDNVKKLILSYLNISDIEGMQNFTELEYLDFTRNNIQTAEQLKYITYLIYLNISDNNLKNAYDFIEELTQIENLGLSSNNISSLEPINNYFSKLEEDEESTNLKYLDLSSNKEIEDIGVLSKGIELVNLNLRDNKISDISALQNLTKLGVLDLSNNNISNIEQLRGVTNLSVLYLDNNIISEISIVNNLTGLQTLGISSNKIEDITSLRNRTLLKSFYANDNKINDVTAIDNASHNTLIDSDGRLELNGQKIIRKLTNQENNQESVTIALPQIFIASQKNTSMFYTVEEFDIKNCELKDTNGDSIFESVTIKPGEMNGENSVITIIGGRADKTTFTVGQPPRPTITYTPAYQNKKVKGSVEATISFNRENVTITNNNGSNKHTFVQNGEFTFEYIDEEGFEEQETARVDWIDNEGPKVTIDYVHDNENNTTQVNIISNEEMQSVDESSLWRLSQDKKTLSKIFSESATETLIVKDELGNETEVTVRVTINKPIDPGEISIQSTIYQISNNKQITQVQPSTTVGQFKSNITTNATNVKILDKSNKELSNEDLIGTGSKIILNENNIYTIIIIGDTSGDGKADIKDILAINKHRLNKIKLDGIYQVAGDVNKDGKCDIKDILQINKFRLGKIKNL